MAAGWIGFETPIGPDISAPSHGPSTDTPEPRLYFHCSAGIHRTGFFAYVLLRLRGLDRAEALHELSALREVTAAQVGDERIDLADEVVSGLVSR